MDSFPPPLKLSIWNNATKKTAEFDLNYCIIDTSSHSDSLKLVELAKIFYFDTQVGGGKINWPGQLEPHPCT